MKSAKIKKWFFWVGMLIVIGTHLYMLGFGLSGNQMVPHAILNLVAAGLFGLAWRK